MGWLAPNSMTMFRTPNSWCSTSMIFPCSDSEGSFCATNSVRSDRSVRSDALCYCSMARSAPSSVLVTSAHGLPPPPLISSPFAHPTSSPLPHLRHVFLFGSIRTRPEKRLGLTRSSTVWMTHGGKVLTRSSPGPHRSSPFLTCPPSP